MFLSLFNVLNRRWIIKQRQLTKGEIKLAQSVFSTHLDLTDIHIIAHRFIFKGYAMSPNGHIYFNEADWIDDFSQVDLYKQSWLIHELVHVWQLQQGIKVVRKAIIDRRYDYVVKKGKTFLHYGVEQQAQMVQDYFIKSQQGIACKDLALCIPFIYLD